MDDELKQPVHAADVPFDVWYPGTDREIHGKALCDVGGRSRVGFGLMNLPANSNTKPSHWHSLEEEHLYVLSGSLTLHLGDQQFEMRTGSYVCFPAGQAATHHLENTTSEPCSYIIVGERIDADEVTYAP